MILNKITYTKIIQGIYLGKERPEQIAHHINKDVRNIHSMLNRIRGVKGHINSKYEFIYLDHWQRSRGNSEAYYKINYPGILEFIFQEYILKASKPLFFPYKEDKINYHDKFLLSNLKKFFCKIFDESDCTNVTLSNILEDFVLGCGYAYAEMEHLISKKEKKTIINIFTKNESYTYVLFKIQAKWHFDKKSSDRVEHISFFQFKDANKFLS